MPLQISQKGKAFGDLLEGYTISFIPKWNSLVIHKFLNLYFCFILTKKNGNETKKNASVRFVFTLFFLNSQTVPLNEKLKGVCFQGRLDIDCDSEDVMVKTVVMGSSTHQANKLVAEGGSLYGINHKHVLTLLATTYDGSSPMMIYSYCSPGTEFNSLERGH